jgi:putative membrane-bound dehydrogenase-like protein
MRHISILLVLLFAAVFAQPVTGADYQFGFSRVDITPTVPVRLSGYGNRNQPFEGIDKQLYVRAMAIQPMETKQLHVLVSVDTIGFPGVLTKEIHEEVKRRHNIPRSRFVICCTHSHTAPHILPGLNNLYSTPLTEEERLKSAAYTKSVRDQVLKAVDLAVQNLEPGLLSIGSGNVTFARNRRVLSDGLWTGFGENTRGPVDHSLPVLRITNASGEKIRGIVFNYACHCTTFGGDYNRVNGDWAGYASQYLEEENDGAVALCTIGCGADANPERPKNNVVEVAQRQGQEIADEVNDLFAEGNSFSRLTSNLATNFGYAGLPLDRPSIPELQENLKSPRQQVRNHAEIMLETRQRMGRFPESYPMPIQTWRFGNDFAMVFLGGEVCVDYALRIKKELPILDAGLSPDKVWVSAYANDVFAYVAPERMRKEGGYEVDFSMIYYLQPGRWSSGTEEVIIRRVKELFQSKNLDEPLSVKEALKTFTLPKGFAIDVIAAEPLVRDPINFSVDAQGRMWVVEMGDYPRGNPLKDLSKVERHEPWDGPPAGRIKILYDNNKDGIFDEAKVFLDHLPFPTGVFPWKDGVLISGAPDIIFARDTDGDDKCDETEVLYSGFEKANPQHRVAGFEYGLDGWLYLSAGTNNKVITCVKTGEKVNVSGRDSRIHPQTGRLEAISGSSQYGRSRDDFGNWFGNSNSQPLYQYVIEDKDLSRNPFVASPSPKNHLTQPATAPPVYPTSRTLDRFNDLHALDRFTSACSPMVFSDVTLGEDVRDSVLICEPVHNLISRVLVDRSKIAFTGSRHPNELQSEFMSSTDNWFRPVRTLTAPDGSLWICDMYRHVIEHPEWIPEAWQAKLDLYAGFNIGRIYRVYQTDHPPTAIKDFTKHNIEQLVQLLGSSNRWERDTAQRLLLDHEAKDHREIAKHLHNFINETSNSRSLIQAGYTLSLLDHPTSPIRKLYRSDDPEVVINALRIWGAESSPQHLWQPVMLTSSKSERIRFELALAAGDASPELAERILASLLHSSGDNKWIRAAIFSSASQVADLLLANLISSDQNNAEIVNPLLLTVLGNDPIEGISRLIQTFPEIESNHRKRVLLLIALEFLEKQNIDYEEIRKQLDEKANGIFNHLLLQAKHDLEEAELGTRELATLIKLSGFESSILSIESLANYLRTTNPPEVVSSSIQSFVRIGAIDRLLSELNKQTPATQAEIQAAILTDSAAVQSLIETLESGSLSLDDLNVATRDQLMNSRNEQIKAKMKQLTMHEKVSSRADVLLAYQPALSLEGNAINGRKLFEKTCSTCHRHQNLGNDFGAKLSALSNKPDDFYLTAILDPNAAAEAKYRGYTIATEDGKIYSGLIMEETATSLKLIRPDGKPELILRTNVEEIVNTGRSFMPEGLEKTLSPQQIADIIAFIKS